MLVSSLALLALSACTYSYIPPVPEARMPTPRIDVRGSAGLTRDGEGLRLQVSLNNIPEADWLAVQWFDPQNRKVASDSTWIAPADEGETRMLYLPGSVTLSAGTWRAVLFYQGAVVRQFSIELDTITNSN